MGIFFRPLLVSVFAWGILPSASTHAQVELGSDNAGNYLVGPVNNWTNGANRGFGFQPWNLTNRTTNGGSSGTFIGNPGSAFINTDTNSGGITDPSFSLYAKPIDNNNTVTAKRALSLPLSIGQTLNFQWAVNWDTEGPGNKGFSIRAGGVDGTELVNVNQSGSASITMNGNNAFTNYGTNAMNWSFRMVNSNTLQVIATPRDGTTNNFSTNLTISSAPDAMSFYATGLSENDGDRRQPYFNNFRITGDRITLVGNFLPNPWSDSDVANVMTRGSDINSFSLTNVRVSNPATIRFKFVNGSFGAANWGLGTNPVTVNTNTGTASGVALQEVKDLVTATDIVMHRAAGFYTFTFNTNTLAFTVERRIFGSLGAFVSAYGLVGNLAAADRDPDGDGLNNQGEYDLNTDPTNDDTDGDGIRDGNEYALDGTNPLLEDTDGDGLRDNWEKTYSLNPANPDSDNNGTLDGNENPDGDLLAGGGPLTNLAEQQYGTNPLNFDEPPLLYSSVLLQPDGFNSSDSLGWQNRLRRDANNGNLWAGLVFIQDTNLATTNRFKFFSSGATNNAWGKGPIINRAVKDAYQPLESTNLAPTNYVRFQIDVETGDFAVTALGPTDTNSNNLPDAYEQWYGARLSNAATVLDPAADYDGDGLSVAQEYAAGSNPVEDVEAPSLQLVGDEIILVETNVTSFTDPGVLTTDQNTNALNVVTVTTNRARVDQLVSIMTPGWSTVTYVATDAAGNTATNTSRKVVVGSWNASYPSLHYYSLWYVGWNHAQGSGRFRTNSQVPVLDVYAQYYRKDKTEGAGRDTNVQCWIGLSTNTNSPSSWAEEDWKLAEFKAGNTGNNDEYQATYSNLAVNTYRIVSRWQFGSNSVYAYGGVNDLGNENGGALGVTSASGTYQPFSVTVNPTQVTYAAIQYPKEPPPVAPGSVTLGYDVYLRFFAQGVTEASGAPTLAGVKAQLGYGSAGGDPSIPGAYNWVDATYNVQEGNDDEFKGVIPASALATLGRVHYAARFTLDNGATWVYGGKNGIWDAATSPSSVLAVGTAPTDIALSATTLPETSQVNAPVATLTTTDADSGDQFTYSLVSGSGSTDNGLFNIDGVNLRATAGLDFETKSSYLVRIRSTDRAGLIFDKPFTISVTDVPEGSTSTFAGWAGSGTATNSETVGKYAIGGAPNISGASEQPVATMDSNTLSLSAIVRTNDGKLAVVGEAGGSLTNWSTNGVSVTASANTNGVPEGHQRQVFSVDRTNSPNRQFLRLKATLAP